jgi:hypothetical protein
MVGLLKDSDPTTIAYLLATYSRRRKSTPKTIEDIKSKGLDPEERFNKIVGYGHSSVRGMGHFPCFIEGCSILESLRFFYNLPLQDGQESSTRYIDFGKNRRFIKPPLLTHEFESICNYLYDNYTYLLDKTKVALSNLFGLDINNKTLKVRSIDCVRYLLPLATETGVGAIQSGREWSRYIRYLSSLDDSVSSDISSNLLELLSKEYPALIGHINPLINIEGFVLDLLNLHVDIEEYIHPSLRIYEVKDSSIELLNRYASLLSPNNLNNQTHLDNTISDSIKKEISALIFDNYDHHTEMGVIGRDGPICVRGLSDIGGTLKDLNRHRSINRFIPFLHTNFNLEEELNRSNNLYALPPYLDALPKLRKEYSTVLDNTYESIRSWYSRAKDYMSVSEVNNWTKRLLPNAHMTQFMFYGSIKDWLYLTRLRVRPGGHISYRLISSDIANGIADLNPLYSEMRLDRPEVFNAEEFLDRS